MTRYLLFISYIGSQFRGVQKQAVSAEPSKLDAETIQGILEICSKRFNPANEPTVCVSSRTDKGVHALRSSAHVDLIRKSNLIYEPAYLAAGYNKQLAKLDLDLRVQDVKLVPDTFHARFSAKSRTYLYRLAVRRPDAPPANGSHYRDIPYIEKNRCHFIQHMQQFNISALKDAALLFPGSRDFRTFMGSKARLPEEVSTVKEMYSLDIVTGSPLLSPKYCPSAAYYDYWDVVCHAKSFLYRQVRRIVGALIAVAEGRISVDEIQYMLDNPSKDSWNTRIPVVPPHGLYLVDVEYDPADLVLSEDTSKQDSLLSSSSSSSESLKSRKCKLHHVTTTVTTPSGQMYEETKAEDGSVISSQLLPSTSPGFVVDMKPDLQVAEIEKGLYLSSQDVVQDTELLKKHGITHILSLGVKPINLSKDIQNKFVFILDIPQTDILDCFEDECFPFLSHAMRKKGHVLVHCNAGVSRSPAVVIAFLMKNRKMSYNEAYNLVKNKRSVIHPNPGFVQQLQKYEKILAK